MREREAQEVPGPERETTTRESLGAKDNPGWTSHWKAPAGTEEAEAG